MPRANNPVPGEDKQFAGTVYGAALGAGSGAIVGSNLALATGPGVLAGAGLGAVAGMLHGMGIDILEEDQIRRKEEERVLRETSWAQEILAEHYRRRLELTPNRDIFPADLFFEGDGTVVKKDSKVLLWHIAQMTRYRMPWSRIIVAAYSTAHDQESSYARHLNEARAKEIATYFIRGGIEPRRISFRPVTLREPILIDPDDSEDRYRQAIEIIAVDY